ncbi:hypothetical protein [Alkalimarinus coralli]|uniref:hypothetical protein n=1 Tax=Alkalimarinus coralli TaxID=2935863 RepID=UPI00202B74CC|nr:hypothetical protein [Alkalimarinus coralli]
MLQKIETYFYAVLTIYIFVELGVKPESVTLNLGVITLNSIEVSNFNLILRYMVSSLGLLCVVINYKEIGNEYRQALSTNKKLNEYVSSSLQNITGKERDKVNSSNLVGWGDPSVNTGAWSSYKFGREVVIITVPILVALVARLTSLFVSVTLKAHKTLLPAIIGGLLLYI